MRVGQTSTASAKQISPQARDVIDTIQTIMRGKK
jgi:hypothetical protein